MTLARFVDSLFAEGRVRVVSAVGRNGVLQIPSAKELDEAAMVLSAMELQYRNELPGKPPQLSRSAMLWGALIAFRTCSFLAHRDSSEDVIRQALAEPCPASASAIVCYSVDLTLRFLPDLVRIAKAVAPNDPLVVVLKEVGRKWSLSSVGIADVGQVDPTSFLDDECLLGIYVDRIIAAKDRSRMDHPRVRDAVRAAIGLHKDLAMELADG